jgi:hypothetical protein
MTVDIDTDNMVATNLEQIGKESLSGEYKERFCFHAEKGHDLFLLTGPYEHNMVNTPSGKISVYSYPQSRPQLAGVIDSLSKLYTTYDKLLQKIAAGPEMYTLVEIPPFLLFSDCGHPLKNLTLTDTIVLSENYFTTRHTLDFLNQIQDNKRDIAVLQRWWQEDLTEDLNTEKWGNGKLTNSISYYLYILGLEKTRAPESYLDARQNVINGQKELLYDFCMPSLPISPMTREVFLVLDTLRTELGDQALKKVLRPLYRLYKTQGTLEADQFSQAIALVLPDIPPEKQAEIQEHLKNIASLSSTPSAIKASVSQTEFSFDMEEYLP